MAGPSSRPKREVRSKPPTFVPHPDDVEAVREGLEAADRGDALSPEESEAYLRHLLGDDPHAK